MLHKDQGLQDNHQAGQGVKPLPCPPSNRGITATGRQNDRLAASDVMDLAFEVTQTSADIYELVGGLAGSLAEPPQGGLPEVRPVLQQYLAHLSKIISATRESEDRVRRLESKIISIQPEIFDAFLEDCWAALLTYKGVAADLAGMIDGNTPTAVAASEILIQIMKRLDSCSATVLGLPGTGMTVSYRCLVKATFDLQRPADSLVGKRVGAP